MKNRTSEEVRFRFYSRWLLVLSILVATGGIGLALLGETFIYAPLNAVFDPYFWGDGAVPEPAQRYRGWIYGVLGGTMAGWGVCLYYLVRHPFSRKERWAWNATTICLGFWFLIDTCASLWWGVTANVILNCTILGAFAIPLVATRRNFTKADSR